MEQEIYYKAEIEVQDSDNIIDIENKLKNTFIDSKISFVKGNVLKFEITTSYDTKFSLEDIESFIYVRLTKILTFYSINVLCIKDEYEIYNS